MLVINKIKMMLLGLSLLFAISVTSQDARSQYAYTYLYQKAMANFEKMHYSQAITGFEKLKAKGWDDLYTERSLAYAYAQMSYFDKAESCLKSLIDRGGAGKEEVALYARVLRRLEKYDEALVLENKYAHKKQEEAQYQDVDSLLLMGDYTVKALSFNSDKASDFGAIPYNRDKELVFVSARGHQVLEKRYALDQSNYLDVFVTDKNGEDIKLFSKRFSSSLHDGPISFNRSGNEAYISRNVKGKDGKIRLQIQYSRKKGKWSKPSTLSFCDEKYTYTHPFWDEKKRTLYFSSDMVGGYGGADLYRVKNKGRNKWGTIENLGPYINTPAHEGFPFVSSKRILFFSSDGHQGIGGLDIFKAIPSDTAFTIKNLGAPVNSSADDFSIYLDKKMTSGYIASNRVNEHNTEGVDNIYHLSAVQRLPQLLLKLNVTDATSQQTLSATVVKLLDAQGEEICLDSMKKSFELAIDRKVDYTLMISQEEYLPKSIRFNSKSFKEKNSQIVMKQTLKKAPVYGIYGTIFSSADDNQALSDVVLTFRSADNEVVVSTDAEGAFRQKLEEDTDYSVIVKKKGFIPKVYKYSTKAKKSGWINANDYIEEIVLEEVELGRSMVIYFELGKSEVNAEALPELEDMIVFMQDNPSLKIEIGAHTDARGSAAYNQKLSEERAEAIVAYMQDKGIDAERIVYKGYGESQLLNQCTDGVDCSEEEHQVNRRCEAKVIEM